MLFPQSRSSHVETLPPLQTDEFLPPVGRWVRLGALLIVGVLAGGIGLATVIPYNVTVQAIAAIRPANGVSVVEARADGTIRQMLVQENQVVEQGAVIAELETQNRSQFETLQRRRKRLQDYIQQYRTQIGQIEQRMQALATPVGSEPDMANLATRRDRWQQQRQDLTRQILYDEATLREIDRELSQFAILAPIAGTVFNLELRNPGQTVRSGDAIAQIVPSQSPLVAKAQVGVQDISQVQVGQPAQIRVSAYPYPDYGSLTGTVQTIAPDATVIRDSNTNTTVSYYEVTVQVHQPYLKRGDRQYPLQPGMAAQADIISRQETLMQSFLRTLRLMTDV